MSLKKFQSPQPVHNRLSYKQPWWRIPASHRIIGAMAPKTRPPSQPGRHARTQILGSNVTYDAGAFSSLTAIMRPPAASPLFLTDASFRASVGRRSD